MKNPSTLKFIILEKEFNNSSLKVFNKDFVDISYGNASFLMLFCSPLGKMELLYGFSSFLICNCILVCEISFSNWWRNSKLKNLLCVVFIDQIINTGCLNRNLYVMLKFTERTKTPAMTSKKALLFLKEISSLQVILC